MRKALQTATKGMRRRSSFSWLTKTASPCGADMLRPLVTMAYAENKNDCEATNQDRRWMIRLSSCSRRLRNRRYQSRGEIRSNGFWDAFTAGWWCDSAEAATFK